MSADFGSIAAAGVSTIGTLAVLGTVAKVGGNLANNVGRSYSRKAPVRYSGKRTMAHRSIYAKTPRSKSYSIFR